MPPGIHALGAAPGRISYRLCCELVASELPGVSQMGRVFCESGIDTDVKQFARKGGNEFTVSASKLKKYDFQDF